MGRPRMASLTLKGWLCIDCYNHHWLQSTGLVFCSRMPLANHIVKDLFQRSTTTGNIWHHATFQPVWSLLLSKRSAFHQAWHTTSVFLQIILPRANVCDPSALAISCRGVTHRNLSLVCNATLPSYSARPDLADYSVLKVQKSLYQVLAMCRFVSRMSHFCLTRRMCVIIICRGHRDCYIEHRLRAFLQSECWIL